MSLFRFVARVEDQGQDADGVSGNTSRDVSSDVRVASDLFLMSIVC